MRSSDKPFENIIRQRNAILAARNVIYRDSDVSLTIASGKPKQRRTFYELQRERMAVSIVAVAAAGCIYARVLRIYRERERETANYTARQLTD